MKKFLSMLLTVALLLTLSSVTVMAETTKSDDVVILYTNDVHTYIDGTLSYDVIAAVKTELEAQYNNVILVDAGDHSQGTAYGSMDKGETIIELMNAAGYDLATLGNHEFDYGMDGCQNLVGKADFPYISCNFYMEENGVRGENCLESYVSGTFGELEVAFVGITTPESFTKSTPAYFQDGNGNYIYGIAGGADGSALYADVQAAVDAATAEGADVVIALGHLGDDAASKPWTSEETIANVSGLDAFIDGHSHSTVEGKNVADKDGNNVVLTQTGEYFDRIGMMVIDAETGAITTDFIEVNADGTGLVSDLYTTTELPSNASVAAIKTAWMTEIDTQLGTVIGSTALTLDNYNGEERLVRKQETNTGDFCADALYYLFDNMGMDVDVAIMNGGGVRSKAVTGELSYQTCKTIHTFGNVACLQTITGQQLLDALEWGARDVGTAECGGFLQVAGITYKIDTTVENTVQKDDKGVWVGGPTEYRVHDVKVYNKATNAYEALDLSASYNLAGYNYTLRDLGDGFAMFDGAVNVLDYVMEDYMVLSNYVKGFANGEVGATNSPLLAKYPNYLVDYSTVNGSGRIVVAEKPEVEPTPSPEVDAVMPSYPANDNVLTNPDSDFGVSAPAGVIPGGSYVIANEASQNDAAYKTAKSVLGGIVNTSKMKVYDISLFDNVNAAIQPNGYLALTVELPAGFDASRVVAFRINDDNTYTQLPTVVSGTKVTFSTDHFSTYVIAEVGTSPKTGEVNPSVLICLSLACAAVAVSAYELKKNR